MSPTCERSRLTSSAIPLSSPWSKLAGARTFLAVPMLKDNEADRRHRHLPSGGAPVHRQADRAGGELRRAGRHRHRERAAAQRAAARTAGAADRDLGGAQGHLSSPGELRAGVRRDAGKRRRASAERNSATCSCSKADRLSRGSRMHGATRSYAKTCSGAIPFVRARGHAERRSDVWSDQARRSSISRSSTGRAGYLDGNTRIVLWSKLGGAREPSRRADAQGRRAGRRHRHLPPGGAAVHRQADRAGDRTSPRRRSSPSRTRGCSASCAKSLGAADGDVGGAQGHLQFDRRAAAGVRARCWRTRRELCDANFGTLWLCEGDAFRTAALHGDLPQGLSERVAQTGSLIPARTRTRRWRASARIGRAGLMSQTCVDDAAYLERRSAGGRRQSTIGGIRTLARGADVQGQAN